MSNEKIYRDALGRFQVDQEKRQGEREEQRRAAEVEILSSARTMEEYSRRREMLKNLVTDTNIPADELDMTEYIRVRQASRKGEKPMTYDDYLASVRKTEND